MAGKTRGRPAPLPMGSFRAPAPARRAGSVLATVVLGALLLIILYIFLRHTSVATRIASGATRGLVWFVSPAPI